LFTSTRFINNNIVEINGVMTKLKLENFLIILGNYTEITKWTINVLILKTSIKEKQKNIKWVNFF